MRNHRSFKIFCSIILAAQVWAVALFAHCEIPCGIYNDKARIEMIKEHVTTIEKSMNKIIELSKAGDKNYNQLVRWVNNKEEHANKIQEIVTQYFMTQRIKLPADAAGKVAYSERLALLHSMLVYAMKSKQTTDTKNCDMLREVVGKFDTAYFGDAELHHLKDEHKKEKLG